MLPADATSADAVLIDGPYLTGRPQLFHSLLRSWTDEPVIVSTRHIDERMRRIHEQATSGSSEDPVVVDCLSAPHVEDLEETSRTRYVSGPGNLTDIGTTVVDIMESRRDENLAVGVGALSPLTMYTSVESVFQFTQVLINQATGQGWPVAAVTSSPTYDDPKHRALRRPFDVVIETRQKGAGGGSNAEVDVDDDGTGDSLFRVRSQKVTTDWRPVSSF